ncbi:Hypothetical_protein [Hexamita inflata]|uniref:Hypothetical_protein n=1 Tax=Hexamita inflata TaxID=28002 RepID=A0AA86PPI8_9EUKA|nr:Hypothetical protein HINF_LOCUS29667 [Hexamita inflata]
MNTVQPRQLVDTIAKQFFVPRGAALECRVALQVMTLPDQLFQQLFVQLALELNASPVELTKTFFDRVVMQHLTSEECSVKVTMKQTQYQFKQPYAHVKSAAAQDFQNRFSAALRSCVHKYLRTRVYDGADNRQLCQLLNDFFKSEGQASFWKSMAKYLPEKSERQLREYFQKSFQRCLYLECISEGDKILLCKLIAQMPQQKPSEVAERFLEEVGPEKYFKRNVIMYVVNRRNQ